MSGITVYTYKNCDTCRRAVKWLREAQLDFTEKPIRETPPTRPELQRMLVAQNRELRRLFNVSGGDYRALHLGEKLPSMSEADALELLVENGNLVKRPFLLGPDGVGLVGYDEKRWAEALGKD